jgi:hypothetical protein
MMKFHTKHICVMTCTASFGETQRLSVECEETLRLPWWCYFYCFLQYEMGGKECYVLPLGACHPVGRQNYNSSTFPRIKRCNGFIMCWLITVPSIQIVNYYNYNYVKRMDFPTENFPLKMKFAKNSYGYHYI